jgi:alpha-D-ribose 1-methylphosphonate 5-triphosphate synthase subunit PhnG
MRACADASLKELSDALDELAPLPAVDVIRAPDIGLVMLRPRRCLVPADWLDGIGVARGIAFVRERLGSCR